MAHECELLKNCGFFKKYSKIKIAACDGFIITYCKGSKMDLCERKIYRKKYGKAPVDDMLPSGRKIAGAG